MNWNHTDSILNWHQKYSDSIHVDPNHTNSNQPIPEDLTNIVSTHDSAEICALEKIFASPINSLIHESQIRTYGSASDPISPPHDSLAEIVAPKGSTKTHANTPNTVSYVPADP